MTHPRILTLLSLATLLATGCTVGDLQPLPDPTDPTDPTDPDPTPIPDFALRLITAPTAELTLGNTAEFTFALTSSEFAGPVTLEATGVPTSWEVAFEPSDAIELPLNGEVVVTMSVVVPTNAEALTGEIGVVAQAEPGQRDGAVTVAVDNRLLIDIDNGIGATLHPFPPTVEIRLGAIVEFRNLDNDIHRIHADDDGAGFPHQENVMVQGESYAVSITRTGGYNYYCHIHEVGLGVGRIEVIDPTP